MTDPLVSAEWLAENLGDVVVLDATYSLPPDPARSRADYETSRIPGARLFEIDVIADTSSGLPHMLPDNAHFSVAMAELGIDGSKPVVVYDRSADHFSAPRVWFTLHLFGLDKVFVLDGGLNVWEAAGRPIESGVASWETASKRDWSLDKERVLESDGMSAVVAQGHSTIIDGRSKERCEGNAPEPRPGLSSGRMPGSLCVPYATLTGADGLFLRAEDVANTFPDLKGVKPILSCGSGMTACVLALALARIGVEARLFDGSWADYGRGHLGPIATGTI